MVIVRDEGSRFDGSIETVWRYMNMPQAHARAHKSTRRHQTETIGGTTMLLRMERNWKGNWVKVANRVTVLPPLGVVTEFLEGPFAGSRMFTVYVPESDSRTRVEVVGDFKSPVLRPDEVSSSALAWLEVAFNEDVPAIRLLQNGQLDESVIGPEVEKDAGAPPIPVAAVAVEREER